MFYNSKLIISIDFPNHPVADTIKFVIHVKSYIFKSFEKVFKKYLSIYYLNTFYKSIQYLYLEYFFEKVFSIPTLNTFKSIYVQHIIYN